MANITGPAFIFNGLPENTTKNDNTISPIAAPVSAQLAAIVLHTALPVLSEKPSWSSKITRSCGDNLKPYLTD